MKIIRCENCGTLLFRVNKDGLIQHNEGQVRRIDSARIRLRRLKLA